MKVTGFLDIVQYSVLEVDRRFRGAVLMGTEMVSETGF
jgi:hypothetical protein